MIDIVAGRLPLSRGFRQSKSSWEDIVMYERFTDRARKVMQLANQEAQRFNHEYIGTEHLLLGLVKEGSGVAGIALKNLGIDLEKVRSEVEKIVQKGPDAVLVGKLPMTPRAKKVIEYSIEEARNLNHNYVGTEHLLLGLLREQEGLAAQVLMNLGLKLEDVHEEVLNLLAPARIQEANSEPSRTGLQKEAGFQDLPEQIQKELKDLEAQIKELNKEKDADVAEQDFVKAAYLYDSAARLKKRLKSLIRQTRLGERGIAYEYDLFIPQIDKNGTPIDEKILVLIKERLSGRFGAFVQRVQKIMGTWRLGNVVFHDEAVVFQIVAGEIEQPRDFFQRLKEELKSEMKLEDVAVLERRVVVL
jgi:ATP-dependent Clp protease ATP-binding subunit ClpC